MKYAEIASWYSVSDSKLDIASTYSVEGQDNPGEKLLAIDLENGTSRNPALFKR